MEQKTEEKDLAMPFFLSSLSHEIRTPLNGVVGYSQLLMQTRLSSIQKTYVSAMNKCCLQLMELINDVIDYSKLAVGKMKVKKECFSIKEVVDVVNNTMFCRLKEKHQTCHYVISRNLPEYIVSDKQKFIQILINLLSNANKFTNIRGFISVHISPKNENMIECTVKDNGIGITEDAQKKLFDAFFQVEQSVGKNGSGLGLAISKRLVDILGGSMRVESKIDQGSSFSFTICYEQPEVFEKKIEKNIKYLRNKYVLVVDDNIDNRIVLGEMLFVWRMRPIVCASGEEALRMIQKNVYDFSLAIVDVCMPSMSGLELARQIKLEKPTFSIIGLSSESETDTSNFDQVLYKPINKPRLLTEIQKIFNGSMKTIRLKHDDEDSVSINDDKNMKILIAEDNENNLSLLRSMLESLGYMNVDTSIDGQSAIDKIDIAHEHDPYDVLLLDLRMPVKNGFDVIRHVMVYDYLRVVVITASVLESDKDKCAELGIKYFISKPYSIEQIQEVMENK